MSERFSWKASTPYSWTMYLFNSSNVGVTGRAGSIVTKLMKDDVYVVTPVVSVVEIDAVNLPGFYAIKYTPTVDGHYESWATDPLYAPDGWLDGIQVVDVIPSDLVDSTLTIQQALQYIYAAVAGVSSGEPGPGDDTFNGPADTLKLTTTYDANGNRTAVVRTP